MRLASESRRPGMIADRRCLVCREPLEDSDGARCIYCAPRLSEAARAVGAATRDRERDVHEIETTIRRIERALRKWQT